MNSETVRKLWKVYCDELIDNGDKTSEDVRQAIATLIREIAYEYGFLQFGENALEGAIVESKDLMDFANKLENLE